MSLPPEPPKSLKDRVLKTIDVDPSALFRISRFSAGEPYLGKSASHRFDDPLKKFGTCYLGFSLECAIAETILHDLMPVKSEFRGSVRGLRKVDTGRPHRRAAEDAGGIERDLHDRSL
jgi:hypothetical protein